jgi:hypothetical protein
MANRRSTGDRVRSVTHYPEWMESIPARAASTHTIVDEGRDMSLCVNLMGTMLQEGMGGRGGDREETKGTGRGAISL